ncbi:MAG TPA: sugar transferase [Bryobacteraceae bacterium]|jgi:exopolysaccharide biosynthesis polyprenyl glycosylphosphotransferase|nr:sugar transferase [Bryobacteraceae bacterium]
MFRSQTRKLKILFGLGDAVLTAAAFTVAYSVREYSPLRHQFFLTKDVYTLLLGFCLVTWVGFGYWLDVYGKVDSARIRLILADSFRQVGFSGLALIVLVYVTKLDISRVFISLFIAVSWFFLVAVRIAGRNFVSYVSREMGAERNVFIVGLGDAARTLARSLEDYHGHGVRILGFVAPPGEQSTQATIELERTYRVFAIDDLRKMLADRVVIDEIHFAVESALLPALEPLFRLCHEEGVCSRIAIDFFPQVNGYMDLEQIGSTPLLTFSGAPANDLLLLAKRTIDVVLAVTGIILLSPLFLLAALFIKLTSRGPVVFRQVRCGLNGRTFTFYKFRSMVRDAEARLDEVAHLNERDLVVMKIRNDPRLTVVGKWLRKFSIDELPQLFNVLKGDMSLVGPRPALPAEVAQYQRWQRRRLRMRPGLTCLWALRGRDQVDFESWMRLDLQYIDNWSLGLDARIILLTIPQVVSGRGAS